MTYKVTALLTNGEDFHYTASSKRTYTDRQLKGVGYSVGLPAHTSIARLTNIVLVDKAGKPIQQPELQAA